MKLLICGDYVPLNRTISLNNGCEITTIFNDLLPFIQESDFSVVNLEAPIVDHHAGGTTKIQKRGPHLRTNKSAAETLRKAGFNIVTLANNHFRDYGNVGVETTLQTCKMQDIKTVGGGLNIETASEPLVLDWSNHKKLGIINICENEYSIASTTYGGSNPLNIVDNYYQITALKNKVDYLFLIFHGGHEGYQLPNPETKKMLHYFVDLGVDAIVSHHAHCFSGYEIYHGKPIFYGLGNFSFDKSNEVRTIWNEGFAVQFDIEESVKFSILPYIQGHLEPGIKLLNGDEKKLFSNKMLELNEIIASNQLLQLYFNKWTISREKMYLSMLDSNNTNIIYSKLCSLGLTRPLKNEYLNLLLNLIRCEAHRNVILNLLNIKNEASKN